MAAVGASISVLVVHLTAGFGAQVAIGSEAWDFNIWCHIQNAKRLGKAASLAMAVDVHR